MLLIEDASRLSRKQADVLNLCEELKFAEVKICFISQGIDSSDEKFQLLLLARGMIDQLFLADTAKRVRRGLEGLIRRGLHTGGRCYGYRSRRDQDGVRLEIFEPEAAIVRRIFQLYADGHSLKTIPKKLNAERVMSPRPQQGRISRSWCPSSIRVAAGSSRGFRPRVQRKIDLQSRHSRRRRCAPHFPLRRSLPGHCAFVAGEFLEPADLRDWWRSFERMGSLFTRHLRRVAAAFPGVRRHRAA